jgi:(p)ppGpp synthase/HD superfamily hydrolase
LLQIAYEIAREAFEGKVDKGGEPYMNHIFIVADPFTRGEMEYNNKIHNQDLEIVAVLHDLLEDCKDWNIERLRDLGFSEAVLDALIAITKTKKESYSEYIERVKSNEYARQVKIVDLEHNMDITRLNIELTSKDIERMSEIP